MAELPTLVLICKRPMLGFGKQRLAAKLGMEVTHRVAEALLACALEDAYNWPGPIVIAPASPDDHDWAVAVSSPARSPVIVLPQVSGNLGQRLNVLDSALRSKGMKQLVFIGSDSPGLAQTDYVAVINALQCDDTVLKPALDGGVVLMASNCPWPELTDLPWSSSSLGEALANSCQEAGHSVATLDEGFDVDEPEDLIKLISLLSNEQRPARHALYTLICDLIHIKEIKHA
ncbi:MAG TPA: DUF2064 domain-containing protein [Nitrosomonas sp.]|nr:DUF2064 domain-containing protein [Nitrosomonas sp.]HMW20102.1 DUF2064 domain-containing protein [Nitrosomonas sp.]HMW69560.1 DUF2064 domain-containing protein [Nitrosomonas sp.]HNM00706.1 DUF2064 domain-containing protein [Nitrosomonas sp.]